MTLIVISNKRVYIYQDVIVGPHGNRRVNRATDCLGN